MTRPNDRIRQLLLGLLCSGITIVLLIAILTVRHRAFVRGLHGYAEMTSVDYEPPIFPRLTDREVANLGWAHSEARHPDSSYINFPEEKPPGVLRIGTFGDSHTAGSEVAPDHDYPSFLQRHFDSAGYDRVEVINFGVESYGVHQSYLMWKTLGEKYDLDVVVLLSFPFHVERDGTFIKNPHAYAGVHARYVLREGGVEIVEVQGGDRMEASARYFHLIPPLRYLRHDRRPSPFLRSLVPDARDLDFNPFYYEKGMDPEEEIGSIYSILFARWADEVESLVIATPAGGFYDDLVGLVASLEVHLLESQFATGTGSTVYRAPGWHPSALGNDVRAAELFSFLTGRAKPAPHLIRLAAAPHSPERWAGDLGPLSRFARITVNILDTPVAAFVERRHIRDSYVLGEDLDFSVGRVWSLLEIPGDEGAYAPVAFPMANKASVSIEFEFGGERIEVAVGRVEAGADILGRIVFAKRKSRTVVERSGAGWSLELRAGEEVLDVRFEADRKIRAPRLLVDGKPVLIGRRPKLDEGGKSKRGGRRYRLLPADGKYVFFRAKAGQFPDLDSLHEARGNLEIVLAEGGGRELRHPMFVEFEVGEGESRPIGRPYSPALTRVEVRERL